MSKRLYNLELAVNGVSGGEMMTVHDAVIHTDNGTITWVGPASGEDHPELDEEIDCNGCLALPGLVDCHTHLIFAGDRSGEFTAKLAGKSYQQIATAGGGIKKTVRATRAASDEELLSAARKWLDVMLRHGVTTVEVKTGYGLSTEQELRLLRLINRLDRDLPIHLVATFLGAHEVPPDWNSGRDEYVDQVVNEQIPAVAEQGIAEFVDVFCEEGVFTVEQAERVLRAGLDHGLKPKIHSDQFSRLGATKVAAKLGAVSCDHLHVSEREDLEAMAENGTVAVALPGVPQFLGEADTTPVQEMLELGVDLALATDFNPGSCMCPNLPLIAQLGCLEYRLRPARALRGVTEAAAKALDRGGEIGRLEAGYRADVCLVDVDEPTELFYHFGEFPVSGVVRPEGLIAFDRRLADRNAARPR